MAVNNHPNPAKITLLPSDISSFQPNPALAIDPRWFSPKGYSLTEEVIVEKGFIDKKADDGIQIFATLVHRKRIKFTSFDKKTTTYSDWENMDGQSPRTLCIQNAEYDKQEEEINEINEIQGKNKIKRTIHYLFRKVFSKEKNSEVFYELTDTLNVDGWTITFTESKIEEDITTFYSDWYPDPDSEIKYEIKEITRPFEKIEKNGSTEVKSFGEEMQKLKIEYKKDPSGKWKECQQVEEEPWQKTQTNLNTTNTETHNQTSENN